MKSRILVIDDDTAVRDSVRMILEYEKYEVIGAASGALCAGVLALYWPALAPSPLVLSVVGMAAMFTAVVRAPLTGIVLTIEMTGRADCTLAMLTACLAATL